MRDRTLLLGELGGVLLEACARADVGRHFQSVSECELAGRADQTEILVVRSGVRVDSDLLQHFPVLMHVIRAGSGTDNIDVEELSRRDIHLHRNPDASAQAVAELALGALVVLARRLPLAQEQLRRGVWAKAALLGEPVSNLRLAIWGAGPVGRACGFWADRLEMPFSFVSWPSNAPSLPQKAPHEVEQWADVHALCLPLRSTTSLVFDAERLARLNRRPYLLNVARLGLLDLRAALDALAKDKLRGLYVDPFDASHLETTRHLLNSQTPLNLMVSPHLGAQREDVQRALARWVVCTTQRLQAGMHTLLG